MLISIVAPFYNEKDNVKHFLDEVEKVSVILTHEATELELVAVDDGSTDSTLLLLKDCLDSYSFKIKIVELSRNFGKESALSAGLSLATGDVVVPMDSDLQHPPMTVLEMVEKWKEGFDVVLAQRNTRTTDSLLYKIFAKLFYLFSNKIFEVKIPRGVGDFRLMDKKVVEIINSLPENRRFMKGIFSWVGFKTEKIFYDVNERSGGVSKFNFFRSLGLAVEGITSFSTAPLKFASVLGMLISSLSFIYALFIISKTIFLGSETPGFPTTIVTILFMGGIQLVCLGLIGEYIGRIYIESKRRPAYIIREISETKSENK